MQIQEKDLLWQFYCRYYRYKPRIEHPKSICNYFWKSVAGFGIVVFMDWNILLFFGMITGAFWLTHTFAADFHSLVYLFLGLVGVVIPLVRLSNYCQRTGNVVPINIALGLILWLFITAPISAAIAGKSENPENFIFGFLWAVLGEIALVGGFLILYFLYVYLFTDHTNLGKNFVTYLSAVKNRVCPMVEPPEEWERRFNKTCKED